jgi:hypothetical protein
MRYVYIKRDINCYTQKRTRRRKTRKEKKAKKESDGGGF